MRVHWRRSDAEKFPVPRVDPVRPDDIEMQLVVLRGLQIVQEAVRQQHTHNEELPADEGTYVFLVLLGRTHRERFCCRGSGGRRLPGQVVPRNRNLGTADYWSPKNWIRYRPLTVPRVSQVRFRRDILDKNVVFAGILAARHRVRLFGCLPAAVQLTQIRFLRRLSTSRRRNERRFVHFQHHYNYNSHHHLHRPRSIRWRFVPKMIRLAPFHLSLISHHLNNHPMTVTTRQYPHL